MGFEPFSTFLRREFPESLLDEFTSTSVFREKNFFVFNSCCEVTSSTTRNNHLFSRRIVFLEKMDFVSSFCKGAVELARLRILFRNQIPPRFAVLPLQREFRLQYRRNSHDSCGSGSDDGNGFHINKTSQHTKREVLFVKNKHVFYSPLTFIASRIRSIATT